MCAHTSDADGDSSSDLNTKRPKIQPDVTKRDPASNVYVPPPMPTHVQSETEYYNGPPEVKVKITDDLKLKLVEDWSRITQKSTLSASSIAVCRRFCVNMNGVAKSHCTHFILIPPGLSVTPGRYQRHNA